MTLHQFVFERVQRKVVEGGMHVLSDLRSRLVGIAVPDVPLVMEDIECPFAGIAHGDNQRPDGRVHIPLVSKVVRPLHPRPMSGLGCATTKRAGVGHPSGTPAMAYDVNLGSKMESADSSGANRLMTDGGASYHDLTGFRRDILQAIAAVDEEPYGLALKAWLDERYETDIGHSRLYQNLDHLVEDDLVTREPIDKRTNAYRLTDAGRALLETQARDLANATEQPRLVTDGGTADDYVLAVYQTYEAGAEFETGPDGTITNHDELVEAGQTYREIRLLARETVDRFDVSTVEPGDELYDDSLEELERGETVRVSELRGESDD